MSFMDKSLTLADMERELLLGSFKFLKTTADGDFKLMFSNHDSVVDVIDMSHFYCVYLNRIIGCDRLCFRISRRDRQAPQLLTWFTSCPKHVIRDNSAHIRYRCSMYTCGNQGSCYLQYSLDSSGVFWIRRKDANTVILTINDEDKMINVPAKCGRPVFFLWNRYRYPTKLEIIGEEKRISRLKDMLSDRVMDQKSQEQLLAQSMDRLANLMADQMERLAHHEQELTKSRLEDKVSLKELLQEKDKRIVELESRLRQVSVDGDARMRHMEQQLRLLDQRLQQMSGQR